MVKKSNYLTSAEAAKVIGVSAIRVRQFAKEGRITSHRFGINLVFDSDEIKKFAKIPRITGGQKKNKNL